MSNINPIMSRLGILQKYHFAWYCQYHLVYQAILQEYWQFHQFMLHNRQNAPTTIHSQQVAWKSINYIQLIKNQDALLLLLTFTSLQQWQLTANWLQLMLAHTVTFNGITKTAIVFWNPSTMHHYCQLLGVLIIYQCQQLATTYQSMTIAINSIKVDECHGCCIQAAGCIHKSSMTTKGWICLGHLTLQTIQLPVGYHCYCLATASGIVGIKVWLLSK